MKSKIKIEPSRWAQQIVYNISICNNRNRCTTLMDRYAIFSSSDYRDKASSEIAYNFNKPWPLVRQTLDEYAEWRISNICSQDAMAMGTTLQMLRVWGKCLLDDICGLPDLNLQSTEIEIDCK